MATSAGYEGLQNFQSAVDDIRSLASCKICLRPFYEPFMLSCGHTFCYGCLRNWLCGGENRKRKKNCPECRAVIKAQPAPNYVLRDLAHMFTDRAELLPSDETLEEHKQGKQEEAQLLTEDRQGSGLFQNVFGSRFGSGHVPHPFWDALDGVHRCPSCNWEMEDGMCGQCGFEPMDESFDDEDESEEGETLSEGSVVSLDNPELSPHDDESSDIRPEPFDTYEATDASDANTESDPFPWGFRRSNQIRDHLSQLDEDDWEDEEDDDEMDDFLDDDATAFVAGYDSEGGGIEDYTRRRHQVPFGDSDFEPSEDGQSQHSHLRYGGASQQLLSDRHNEHTGDDATVYDQSSEGEDEDVEDTIITAQARQHKRQRRVVISSDDDESQDYEDAAESRHSEDSASAHARQHSGLEASEEEQSDDEEPVLRRVRKVAQRQGTQGGSQVQRLDRSADLDDDDDDDEGVRTSQMIASTSRGAGQRTRRTRAQFHQHENSDEDDNDNDHDDDSEDEVDDDDEELAPRPRTRRRGVQGGSPVQHQSQRASREQNTVHSHNHGYHPYARQQDNRTNSQSRYRGTASNARNGTRATYVCG